jgi:hypothetical protein
MFYPKKKRKSRFKVQEKLETQLKATLKKYVGEALTPETMRAIRNDIIDSVRTLLYEEKITSTESVYWLSDFLFKQIKLNDGILMSDQVVINEYKASEIPLSEVYSLVDIFRDTDIGDELQNCLGKRLLS